MGAIISLSTVSRAVKRVKHELDLSAIRYETAPGQQAQADWADFRGYTATVDGYERPLHAFFLILGHSRMRYVEFVTEMTTASLIRCIENALNYFGGTPKEILFDNMPQVVNRCLREGHPHQLERELVPEFTSFADYYGFDIVLARIRRPQEKGKVERFVGYFKDSFIPFLDKKTGHDLNELNDLARKWCDTNDLGDFYYLYFNRQDFRSHDMYFRRGVALTASSLRNHPVMQLNFVLFARPIPIEKLIYIPGLLADVSRTFSITKEKMDSLRGSYPIIEDFYKCFEHILEHDADTMYPINEEQILLSNSPSMERFDIIKALFLLKDESTAPKRVVYEDIDEFAVFSKNYLQQPTGAELPQYSPNEITI